MLLVIGILIPRLAQLKTFITGSRLEYTGLIAFIITLLAGIIISIIEPKINGIGNGMWWAWTTMTHSAVDSGFAISTISGRLLTGFLILAGIGLVAAFTANLVLLLIRQYFTSLSDQHQVTTLKLENIVNELSQITCEENEAIRLLRDIQIRLRHLEDAEKRVSDQDIIAKRK